MTTWAPREAEKARKVEHVIRRRSLLTLLAVIVGGLMAALVVVAPVQALDFAVPPQNVKGVISTQTRIGIVWDEVQGASSYRVHYSTAADFSSSLRGLTTSGSPTSSGALTVTLPSLTPGTTYYFRVAVVDGTTLQSPWSDTASYATKPLMGKVSVGTYNIHNPNRTDCTEPPQDREDWCVRAPWVAYAIVSEGLRALGIQEAYQASERRDLLNRVNGRISGSDPYAMAPKPGDDTGYDNRILYDTRVFTEVAAGGMEYRNQLSGEDTPRHLAWAKLKHRASGIVILFVTTHLQPGSGSADTIDALQWAELITETDKRKAEAPAASYVVAAGDFNSSRYESPSKYRIADMKQHGYGDVLGQQYRTDATSGARAQVRKDAWLSSGNHFDPIASHNANADHTRNGYSIDWIFASNALKVSYYKEWVRWSTYPKTFALPIASDHHLVRATIYQ